MDCQACGLCASRHPESPVVTGEGHTALPSPPEAAHPRWPTQHSLSKVPQSKPRLP